MWHADISWQSSELIRYGHGRLIFLILAQSYVFGLSVLPFGPSVPVFQEVSEHYQEWHGIWHVDESCPLSELIRFWSRFVDSPYFGRNFNQWTQSDWAIPVIFRRTQIRNGMKLGMRIDYDHLQKCLNLSQGLLIFASILLSETDQLWCFWAFSGGRKELMSWNLAYWCILTIFRMIKFWLRFVDFYPMPGWPFGHCRCLRLSARVSVC